MAGGETSGSAMASIIYFLLKTPEAHQKLNEEVRSAYSGYDDIDVASTMQLEYLMAVLKEGMRIFPTAPQGTPRVSPGVMVERHFVPKGVSLTYRYKDTMTDMHTRPSFTFLLGPSHMTSAFGTSRMPSDLSAGSIQTAQMSRQPASHSL